MTNPKADPTKANAARKANIAAKVVAAGKWLDAHVPGSEIITRRLLAVISISVLIEYADEYAATLSIHPRTARRYLDAALQQETTR